MRLIWHGSDVLFVFSILDDGRQAIYLSTDTSLDELTVISLYSKRFEIEHTFKQLVHTVHGFAYRFWTKAVDKSQRVRGSLSLSALKERELHNVLGTIRAYHTFMAIACVALTGLQCMALRLPDRVTSGCILYFRTPTRENRDPSEQIAQRALQLELSRFLVGNRPPLLLWEILREMQDEKPTGHPLEVIGQVA